MAADVLDAVGLPWKCYSVADGSVPSTLGSFNPLIFFEQNLINPVKLANATADISQFSRIRPQASCLPYSGS